MESYITDLLKDADLSVLTKKHIRLKYKEHVGRELLPDEKSRINDMVYAFVKELSALQNQTSSPVQSDASPEKKKDSPGNKENKRHEKSSKLIIKGQVVDRNDLYKKSNKERKNSKEDITPHKQDKHDRNDKRDKNDKCDNQDKRDKNNKSDKHDKQKKISPDHSKSGEITHKSPYARAAKLKINDVMSAVLGDIESSSEVSSVSSLSDMSLSEVDEKPQKPNMTEALQKLNEARQKKIQMSTEKKRKLKLDHSEKKVRRSLPMKDSGNRVKDLKSQDKADDSDTLSLISEISSGDNDRKTESRLGNSPEHLATSVDSGEITLIKTPETYVKNKTKLASEDKRFVKIEDKKKKLVKRKIKKKEISSDSESDSEPEVQRVKSKLTSENKKSRNSKNDLDIDSKVKMRKKSKIKTEKDTSKDKSGKNLVTETESDSSSGDTPLAKKKSKLSKPESDSELSTGDTPLAKKKSLKSKLNKKAENNGGDTPLIKKKAKSSQIDSDSDSTGDTPLAKKKSKLSKPESDSELSTGDTPLAKKKSLKSKLNKKAENNGGDTPLIKKKAKCSQIDSDSDGDTPLAKKKNSNSKPNNNAEHNAGDTPLIKKKVNKMDNMKSLTNLKRVKPKKHETEVRKTYPKRSRNSTDQDADKTSVTEDKSGHMTSESSSGDTSLAQLKRKMVSKPLESKGRKEVHSDSDSTESPIKINEVSNDVELNSDSENGNVQTLINGKVSKKRKLSTNSNISTENTPTVKKKRRKQTLSVSSKTGENESDEDSNDSELRDLSTDDTPLVKKRSNLRKKAAIAKTSSKTIKAKADNSYSDSQDDISDADESLKDNSVGSSRKTDDVFKNDGEVDSPLKVKKPKSRNVRIDSSGSNDKEEEPIKVKKQKRKSKNFMNSRKTKSDDNDLCKEEDTGDSDDSDDIPLASIKSKVYDLSSDSEDDVPLSAMAAQGKKAKEDELETEENINERTYLRLLRQICRECQMFVRNDRELVGCDTNQDKIEKLEQMLRDVGMKGKPSMRKAEEVKLQKEAKELSADNIISSETGRVMRKVKSIYARRTISPLKPVKPMQNPFTGLKDIVDSDGTESTD